MDGKTYTEVGKLEAGVPDRAEDVVVKDYEAKLSGVEARYVRVQGRNYGRIPEWHPGKGSRAWIFVDEILIEAAGK